MKQNINKKKYFNVNDIIVMDKKIYNFLKRKSLRHSLLANLK